MKAQTTRVLVFATVLLTAPLLPAWPQAPVHPRPQLKKKPSKPPVVVVSDTPIDQGDPQAPPATPPPQEQTPPPQEPPAQQQGAPQEQTTVPEQPQSAAPQETPPPAPQGEAPGQAKPKTLTPEEIGVSFAPPPGWQQGDPTKMTLAGIPCCVWTPDNVASIVAFVQQPGRPLRPRILLDESAQALQSAFGAEVKSKEVKDFGGMKGFSLVVTAPGTGSGIDGKGTVSTTQHWVAIPRAKDVVIFLMTTPDANFAQNEQVFQGLLGTLKISGTQTPAQQASK
jgi:hypothetical protein